MRSGDRAHICIVEAIYMNSSAVKPIAWRARAAMRVLRDCDHGILVQLHVRRVTSVDARGERDGLVVLKWRKHSDV